MAIHKSLFTKSLALGGKDMRNRFFIMGLILAWFCPPLLAQQYDGSVIVRPVDFRIDVRTSRTVYVDRDVLRITVELFNESDQEIKIISDWVDLEDPTDADVGRFFPAQIDDEPVYAVVRPEVRRVIIGVARLIPLNRPVLTTTNDADIETLVRREYKLPLFGSPIIPPHSTRIISTMNILLTALTDIDPQPLDASVEPGSPVDICGRWFIPWPGEYLLDCVVNTLSGTKTTQAQKIIRIGYRKIRPVPVAAPTVEDQRALFAEFMEQIKGQFKEAAVKQNNILAYVRLNSKYLNVILRHLLGLKPELPQDTTSQTQPSANQTTTQNQTNDGAANPNREAMRRSP
jgi:hypothetical protein